MDNPAWIRHLSALTNRSAELQRASMELIARSTRTQAAAHAAQREARDARIASLVVCGNVPQPPMGGKKQLLAALDAALDAAQTTLGNVQLFDHRGVLRIHAQRGFARPFLEFFDEVRPGLQSACGAALVLHRQIVVPDVLKHPVFRGKATQTMIGANALAVVSSPIVDPTGKVHGMLSTHYGSPGARKALELRMLDVIARHLGAVLGERAA